MNRSSSIDVGEFIDRHSMSRFQWLIGILCFWIVVIDGFDTVLIGFVVPDLIRQWGTSKQALAPLLSAALFGLMFGAFAAGPLADKFGRRRLIILAVSLIAVATVAGALSQNLPSLAATRFVAGIGLGAAVPASVSLWGEFVPKRLRSTLVAMVCSGFPVGAMLSGLIAAWIIPVFGWRTFMACGAGLAAVTALCVLLMMPESVKYLALRGERDADIRETLARMTQTPPEPNARFTVSDVADASRSSVRTILSGKILLGSIVLWICFFSASGISFLMLNWLPTMLSLLGYSVRGGGLAVALFSWGATLGSISIGWLMTRFGTSKTLIAFMVLGGALLYSIAFAPHHATVLFLILFGCGLVIASQPIGLNAYAASYYPTDARATGICWMHGIGRLGSITSAFAGAQLLSLGWSILDIFLATSFIPIISILALLTLNLRRTIALDEGEPITSHIAH